MDLKDLVDQKAEWMGGALTDYGDPLDRVIRREDIPMETKIVDLEMDEDSFYIVGEDFRCGGSRRYVGICLLPEFDKADGDIALYGYGGHEFHIARPADCSA